MPFAHLTLATRDVARASAFFENALGFRPIRRPDNIGRRAAWLSMAPDQELHLIEVEGFAPSPFEREFGRHVALTFPRAAFPDLKRRLEDCGAEIIAPERPTPFERFFFRSPDGYVFEVLDAEHAPEDGIDARSD
jgi:catechol 2,3-dioxygenase-like lactoylglutathione lyase family enzyme